MKIEVLLEHFESAFEILLLYVLVLNHTHNQQPIEYLTESKNIILYQTLPAQPLGFQWKFRSGYSYLETLVEVKEKLRYV
jgi:hypothetical protein